MLDAPVSGGPRGAASGRLALWVGGDEQIFNRHKKVLDAIGDAARYIGPIGAGSVAKLVHNCAGYAIQTCLAEVFTMGVKAGVEPLALWEAVRQGAGGRRRTFDALGDHFLTDSYDPPDFALRLAHKDVTLATELARELKVPMPMANLAHGELTAALNRGWDGRNSRVAMQPAEGARRGHDQGRSGRGQGGARARRQIAGTAGHPGRRPSATTGMIRIGIDVGGTFTDWSRSMRRAARRGISNCPRRPSDPAAAIARRRRGAAAAVSAHRARRSPFSATARRSSPT